jgi:hypothetical protein
MTIVAVIAGGLGLSFLLVIALAAGARQSMPAPPAPAFHPDPLDHHAHEDSKPALA